jgi:hypothetical protein
LDCKSLQKTFVKAVGEPVSMYAQSFFYIAEIEGNEASENMDRSVGISLNFASDSHGPESRNEARKRVNG